MCNCEYSVACFISSCSLGFEQIWCTRSNGTPVSKQAQHPVIFLECSAAALHCRETTKHILCFSLCSASQDNLRFCKDWQSRASSPELKSTAVVIRARLQLLSVDSETPSGEIQNYFDIHFRHDKTG